MTLRNLGKSGLRVSLVGLGCNNFGGRMDLESSTKVIHKALDAGPDPISPAFEKLTPRQQDILRLAAQGLHYKEIADQLKLSQRTVTNHFHQIYQRLGVTNRVEALNKIRTPNPKA